MHSSFLLIPFILALINWWQNFRIVDTKSVLLVQFFSWIFQFISARIDDTCWVARTHSNDVVPVYNVDWTLPSCRLLTVLLVLNIDILAVSILIKSLEIVLVSLVKLVLTELADYHSSVDSNQLVAFALFFSVWDGQLRAWINGFLVMLEEGDWIGGVSSIHVWSGCWALIVSWLCVLWAQWMALAHRRRRCLLLLNDWGLSLHPWGNCFLVVFNLSLSLKRTIIRIQKLDGWPWRKVSIGHYQLIPIWISPLTCFKFNCISKIFIAVLNPIH